MKTNRVLFLITYLIFCFFGDFYQTALGASSVTINASVGVSDATGLTSTPGNGTCTLNWINSTTANVDTSRITGTTGSPIFSKDVAVLDPATWTFTGLTAGVSYTYSHFSLAGALSSHGVLFPACTPTGGGGGSGGGSGSVCGNGAKESGEQCDDGNTVNTDACLNTCKTAICGDTIIETGLETCDDGNLINGDGCSNTCSTETTVVCGNGIKEALEECDDGNILNTDACLNTCKTAICGDTIIETGVETCDDGNLINGDGCSQTCDIEQECGNGTKEPGEACDDGNNVNGDGCTSACDLDPVCGDSTKEDPEQCDDGNLANGDGCSETCELEEIVTVKFEIKGAPEFRVKHATDPNLSLNSQFLVYKSAISHLDGVGIKLDAFGNAMYEGEIVTGNYDFGLNGEAHNTKLIRGIEITPTTEVVTLDFTYAETVKLIAGDTVDDEYINGVDMSKLIQQYRMEGDEVLSDLNREGYVNGIDASIVITNYRKAGEKF